MASQHAGQPASLLGDGLVPASLAARSLTSRSLARIRFVIVMRLSQNRPVPGLRADVREAQEVERLRLARDPAPARFRAAYRPNSISRVLSGCSSSPNFANRSRSSARNRSASSRARNPTMKSSANRTMITSPCACRRPPLVEPTGRRRSAGTRSRATAIPMPLAVTPPRSADHVPVLDDPRGSATSRSAAGPSCPRSGARGTSPASR